MGMITTQDGTQICYKDSGAGQPAKTAVVDPPAAQQRNRIVFFEMLSYKHLCHL